jgi:adenosylcobinamide-GDP ribazoletransferase
LKSHPGNQPEAVSHKPAGWVALLAAIQFLMISPAFIKRDFTTLEMGRSVGYYPLVGMLIGAILVGANWVLARIFPDMIVVGVLLAIWILITGALHLDGFLDTCDGLLGGFTPESRLEIMRDERIGAYAFSGGVLLLLLKFSAMYTLADRATALFLTPVMGRWAITLAIVSFPYARQQGLGREIKNAARWQELLLASIFSSVAAWLAASWIGLLIVGFVALLAYLIGRFTMARLPGLTGDIYGAVNEIVELAVLLVFTTVWLI